MALAKKDMIETLQAQYTSWQGVYDVFHGKKIWHTLHGWHIAFDGPSIDDMYLTTAHPMSDESGELITIADFILTPTVYKKDNNK